MMSLLPQGIPHDIPRLRAYQNLQLLCHGTPLVVIRYNWKYRLHGDEFDASGLGRRSTKA